MHKKESDYILNDDICKYLTSVSNKKELAFAEYLSSINKNEDYNITYKISVELDELIAKYYRTTITLRPKPKKKRTSIREIQELFSEK